MKAAGTVGGVGLDGAPNAALMAVLRFLGAIKVSSRSS